MTRARRLNATSATGDVAATASKVELKIRRLIIQTAFEELLQKFTCNKDGIQTCAYGEYTKIIDKYHQIGHKWLKRRQLTYLMEQHIKKGRVTNNSSSLNNVTIEIDSADSQDISTITDPVMENNSGGRPKGTTCAAKEQYQSVIKKAMTDAAILYQNEKKIAETKGKNVRNGTLKEIVSKIEQERGIANNTINLESIRTRVTRCNVTGEGTGSVSPLQDIEKIIVQYCIRLARIGSALNKEQVIMLAEDLIHGTPSATNLMEFKRQRGVKNLVHSDGKNKVIVGRGWYKRFMERNKHVIIRRRLKVRDRQRLTYCTYPNFECMYQTVYEDMVACGAAKLLEQEVLVNIKGEIVHDKNESDGLPTRYIMERPELVLFVDETGSNTNQKSDPLRGNEKRIVGCNGDGFGVSGSISDNHFTVMCFQSGTGEPVLCAIIFKSEKVRDIPIHWETGIDLRKIRNNEILPGTETEVSQMYIDHELDENGALGGGPVCTFRGKKIKCYCCCSPSASINTTILTDMLRYMDSNEVYDRRNGETPILILDGHHSRMDVEFLEYINQPEHKWFVCLGVPYGTHKWQVADSSQVNGMFKIQLAKTKCEYLRFKNNNQSLTVTDIVPIVKSSFAKSFANVANTQKAIAERGWGPALNYRLLLDESLSLRPKDTPTVQSTNTDSNQFVNVTTSSSNTVRLEVSVLEDFASEVTDALLSHQSQEEGRAKAVQEKIRVINNREKHIEIIKNLPKISSGQLMSNRWLRMDENVLENRRRKRDLETATKTMRDDKKQKLEQQQQQRYQAAINKCLTTKQTLTTTDIASMIKQATIKGDSPVRKGKEAMVNQLHRRFHRLEPFLPIAAVAEMKSHLMSTLTPKSKTSKEQKESIEDSANIAVAEPSVVPVMRIEDTSITGTTLLGNYDPGEEAINSLLELASDARIFL
jgi:hypothetical protein